MCLFETDFLIGIFLFLLLSSIEDGSKHYGQLNQTYQTVLYDPFRILM